MKVKSESEVAQSRPTPSDPMDCSPPGSSIVGCHCLLRILDGGMATHPSILAWETPWTEEPGWLQSRESQKTQTGLSD